LPVRTDPIVPYTIPKPHGGIRRMAILSARDADMWSELAGRVAPSLEPRLGTEVTGNRCHLGSGRWRLATLSPSLRRARSAARRLESPLLLRTDVEAFYASVTPSVLAASLVRAGTEPRDARLAADLIEGWGNEGYAGLPIGPPGSAVLANAVLMTADHALRPLTYVRWVDDYLIGCRSEAAAGAVLERIDEALASLGLVRSRRKTAVLDRPRYIRWPAAASLAEG
jgi:CRISPR-associated protein Cas1